MAENKQYYARIAQASYPAAEWPSDLVLFAGEVGWESDTKRFKVGNGQSKWGELGYYQQTKIDGKKIITEADLTDGGCSPASQIFLSLLRHQRPHKLMTFGLILVNNQMTKVFKNKKRNDVLRRSSFCPYYLLSVVLTAALTREHKKQIPHIRQKSTSAREGIAATRQRFQSSIHTQTTKQSNRKAKTKIHITPNIIPIPSHFFVIELIILPILLIILLFYSLYSHTHSAALPKFTSRRRIDILLSFYFFKSTILNCQIVTPPLHLSVPQCVIEPIPLHSSNFYWFECIILWVGFHFVGKSR